MKTNWREQADRLATTRAGRDAIRHIRAICEGPPLDRADLLALTGLLIDGCLDHREGVRAMFRLLLDGKDREENRIGLAEAREALAALGGTEPGREAIRRVGLGLKDGIPPLFPKQWSALRTLLDFAERDGAVPLVTEIVKIIGREESWTNETEKILWRWALGNGEEH